MNLLLYGGFSLMLSTQKFTLIAFPQVPNIVALISRQDRFAKVWIGLMLKLNGKSIMVDAYPFGIVSRTILGLS